MDIKMMKQEYYDAVFVYETELTKNITNAIIEQYYMGRNILVIDGRGNTVRIHNEIWNINIGSRKKTLLSLPSLLKWNKHIKTHELIGTFIPTLSGRFYEMFINYDNLVLMDDGIGTPVILSHPNRWLKYRPFIQVCIFNGIIFFLFFRKKYKTTKWLLSHTSKYYTIYNLPVGYSFPVKKVDLLSKYNITNIKKGIVGVIGALGTGKGSNNKRNDIIRYIYSSFSLPLYYYTHPREKDINMIDTSFLAEIIQPAVTIEEYFSINGIPEIIIAYVSTVLLNIRAINIEGVTLYYIYDKKFEAGEYYYELLDAFNIKRFELN